MTTTHLTPEQRAERDAAIAEARDNGMGVEAAAELFSIDKANITRAVQRHEKRMRAQAAADSMDYADPSDYTVPDVPGNSAEQPPEAPSATEPALAPDAPPTTTTEPPTTPATTPAQTMKTTLAHSRPPQTPTEPDRDAVSATRRATMPEELPEGPERTVFTHSEATRAVWMAARARGASPWATLGYVMARTATATGPHLRLPPIVGGEVAMNMLIGMVGKPGVGKGKARSVARSMFIYANHTGVAVDVPEVGVGSGEGIADKFKVRTRKDDDGDGGGTEYQDTDRALFDSTEISAMAQKSARQGSTLLPMLCMAFMGENLGNQNGTAESSRMVPDHSYRMCLTVGIQPDRAGVLLDDVGGGTPQRFVWLPVTYPGRPDAEDTPEDPEVFTIRLPFGTTHGNAPMRVQLPGRAVTEIRRADVANSRGEATGGMDGHLLLTREKVAVALALMGGETTVTDADWSVAGSIIGLSTSTREMCRAACKGAGVEAAAARRIEDAEGRDQAADAMAEKYARTVRERVLSALDDADGVPVSHSDLNRRLSGRKQSDGLSQRDRLPEALRTLVDDGLILSSKTVDGNGHRTTDYRLPCQ